MNNSFNSCNEKIGNALINKYYHALMTVLLNKIIQITKNMVMIMVAIMMMIGGDKTEYFKTTFYSLSLDKPRI